MAVILSFADSFFTTDMAAFVGAPLAGEAIRAGVFPVLQFAVRYIDHSPVVWQFLKWHYALNNS